MLSSFQKQRKKSYKKKKKKKKNPKVTEILDKNPKKFTKNRFMQKR